MRYYCPYCNKEIFLDEGLNLYHCPDCRLYLTEDETLMLDEEDDIEDVL